MRTTIQNGGPGDLPLVTEVVPNDAFENAIRRAGVVNACKWFGYQADSQFTRESIEWLQERGPMRAEQFPGVDIDAAHKVDMSENTTMRRYEPIQALPDGEHKLYTQAALDAVVAAERERCAKLWDGCTTEAAGHGLVDVGASIRAGRLVDADHIEGLTP